MDNKTLQNDRPEAVTSDLPLQRKILAGPSAAFIVSEAGSAGNRRGAETMGVVLARVYKFILDQQEKPTAGTVGQMRTDTPGEGGSIH